MSTRIPGIPGDVLYAWPLRLTVAGQVEVPPEVTFDGQTYKPTKATCTGLASWLAQIAQMYFEDAPAELRYKITDVPDYVEPISGLPAFNYRLRFRGEQWFLWENWALVVEGQAS